MVESLPKEFNCGVYYGWSQVDDGEVHKMVMSIGWNPHYKNVKKSMVKEQLKETIVLKGSVDIQYLSQ